MASEFSSRVLFWISETDEIKECIDSNSITIVTFLKNETPDIVFHALKISVDGASQPERCLFSWKRSPTKLNAYRLAPYSALHVSGNKTYVIRDLPPLAILANVPSLLKYWQYRRIGIFTCRWRKDTRMKLIRIHLYWMVTAHWSTLPETRVSLRDFYCEHYALDSTDWLGSINTYVPLKLHRFKQLHTIIQPFFSIGLRGTWWTGHIADFVARNPCLILFRAMLSWLCSHWTKITESEYQSFTLGSCSNERKSKSVCLRRLYLYLRNSRSMEPTVSGVE